MAYIPPQTLQQTAFGELNVAELVPYIQIVPVYNLIPANFRTFTVLGGSATVENKMFKASSGTSAYGYSTIQSFRSLNYRTGQGGLARYTAIFETSAANSQQGAGLFTIGDELSFGYNGTTFGIWYRTGGYSEVREIQVTVAAGGSETLTLTLNGVAYSIPITSGTVQKNAHEIASWLSANQSVWRADQVNDKVIIMALSDGAKSGTYTYSSSGTSTGIITSKTVGVAKTSTHIPKADWNVDTATWLNPAKGNVYQIKYQYLGFGAIKFFVEYPETGEFKLVHTIEYANLNTLPSLMNPSLKLGLYAYNGNIQNNASSTTNLTVRVASFLAATEGSEVKTRNPRGYRFTQASVSTTLTNILTIRNRNTYNYLTNQVEVEPKYLIIASESTKNTEFSVFTNPTFSGNTNFQEIGTNLVIDVDTTNNTVSGGTEIISGVISPSETLKIDLDTLRLRIPPSVVLTIAAKVTSGAASSISASLVWYEDLS